jgi:hypothetical protein
MNQAPAGQTGQSAQEQNRAPTGHYETKARKSTENGDHSSQGRERANQRNAQDRDRLKGQNPQQGERNGSAAQQQNRRGNNAAAQREHGGMQGLQGNATGMNVKLTDEQRTRIRGNRNSRVRCSATGPR